MIEPTKLLTLEEAAQRLRKSPAQMRWLRHKRQGPRSALIGGRVMYREADVEEYVSAAFATERP